MNEQRRVVITGMGAVTCVGNSVPQLWDSVLFGRSGISTVTSFNTEKYKTKIGGFVKDLEVTPLISEKELRRLDKFIIFAVHAFDEARKSAGLPVDLRGENSPIDPQRVGTCVGSGIGGLQTLEEQCRTVICDGPSRISPFMIPSLITNMASGMIAIRSGAMGANFSVSSACSTGTHAIGESFEAIRRGTVDMMFTGGSEASICPLAFAGFCAMRAMSTHYNDNPAIASRPFDLNRDGFVMSEGAGVLVLEEYEHAKKRNAPIVAEIVGYGATADAFHITAPLSNGAGAAKAYRLALDEAGVSPESVEYINAHGTSTKLNDVSETTAIKTAFGEHAYKMSISSTKGVTGHALGAAGAIETILTAQALCNGIIPPTINYETPDPECDLDYTPNQLKERKIIYAANTNLGFGGHNAVLLLKKI